MRRRVHRQPVHGDEFCPGRFDGETPAHQIALHIPAVALPWPSVDALANYARSKMLRSGRATRPSTRGMSANSPLPPLWFASVSSVTRLRAPAVGPAPSFLRGGGRTSSRLQTPRQASERRAQRASGAADLARRERRWREIHDRLNFTLPKKLSGHRPNALILFRPILAHWS